MDTQKVYFLSEKFSKYFKDDEMVYIRKRIAAARDEAFEPLNTLTLKSKTTTTLLSIFLGGPCAGRFYLGDWQFALIKIFSTFGLSLLSLFARLSGAAFIGSVIPLLLGLGIIAWYIAEIVICSRRCNDLNYQKVINCLKMFGG